MIFYVPGMEDKNDKAILEESLENQAKAISVIYQETPKFRKIYILPDNNKKFDFEKYIKEIGFLADKNVRDIDNSKYKGLELKCVASDNTNTFELQSNALEKDGIIKFVVTAKVDKNETHIPIKQTENQNIEKDTKFYVKAILNEEILGEDNNYTITSGDKELAKCSKE